MARPPGDEGRSRRSVRPRPSDATVHGGAGTSPAGPEAAGAKATGQGGGAAAPSPSAPSSAAPASAASGPTSTDPAPKTLAGGPRPRPVPRAQRRRLARVEETSAGGLVVDLASMRAALIGRLDRRGRLLWSLPKGHLEAGETTEDAAVREVEEETGIRGRVLAPLGTVDFWFVAEDRRVHKTVHHFLLEAHGGELSDADVEVTEVAWVPLEQLRERLAYDGERRLVDTARALLSDTA